MTSNGAYTASQVVTVTKEGGSTEPFYAINVIFALILIDVNGNNKWENTANVHVSIASNASYNNSYRLNNHAGQENKYCGDNSKKDENFLVMQYFSYNFTGDIVFQLNL